MTDIRKLEIELIDAVIKGIYAKSIVTDDALLRATEALLFGCDDCNYDRHQCPGDGKSIPHGAGNCGEHDDDAVPEISNERRRLADYLSEYAHGVVEEWMRIVEVDESTLNPGSGFFQTRATWAGDGTFILGEHSHGDEFGQYRLIVKVEALPDLPPIGPENDPAQAYETVNCPHCSALSQDLPAHIADYHPEHLPTDYATGERGPLGNATFITEPARTEWIATTFLHIEKGDRLRIGQEEATVKDVRKDLWHVDNSDRYHPKPWEHVEVRADVGFGMAPFPTDTAVEILCDEERKAQLIMSEAGLRPRLSSTEEN